MTGQKIADKQFLIDRYYDKGRKRIFSCKGQNTFLLAKLLLHCTLSHRPDISFLGGYYIISISRPKKRILYPITITAKKTICMFIGCPIHLSVIEQKVIGVVSTETEIWFFEKRCPKFQIQNFKIKKDIKFEFEFEIENFKSQILWVFCATKIFF
jgi:hypothetical protein